MPRRITLKTPADFRFRSVVNSHGWLALRPFRWDEERESLSTVLRTVAKRPLGVVLQETRTGVSVRFARAVGPRIADRVRSTARRMLALDSDLDAFWEHCRSEESLTWIADRGMGPFLRAEDLWEDLAKTLLTTNCTWTGTQSMVTRLVEGFGVPGDGGVHAFPNPAAVVEAGPGRLKDEARVGYRANGLWELARLADSGGLEGWESLDTDALAERLGALAGFGPYAVSSSLMVLGATDRQILDSWALAQARDLLWNGRAGTTKKLERHYARHGRFRGLVAWFDLHPHRG